MGTSPERGRGVSKREEEEEEVEDEEDEDEEEAAEESAASASAMASLGMLEGLEEAEAAWGRDPVWELVGAVLTGGIGEPQCCKLVSASEGVGTWHGELWRDGRAVRFPGCWAEPGREATAAATRLAVLTAFPEEDCAFTMRRWAASPSRDDASIAAGAMVVVVGPARSLGR
jgi:hypothetical protein